MSSGDWSLVAGLVAHRATERADGVSAFGIDGRRVTWGGVATRADAVTAALSGAKRVAVFLPNRPDFAAAVFGAWRAGASAVVVSALSSPAEAALLVESANADVILTTGDQLGAFGARRTVDFDALELASVEPAAPPADALVVFTSGTTGRPKGIVHTGHALQASLRAMAASSRLEADGPRPLNPTDRDPNLVLTPLSHVSGFLAVLFAWWAGKPIVVFDRFDPEKLARVVSTYSITTLRLVPAMVYDLVHAPESVRLTGVKYATAGTAALAPELARRFEARYGFPILTNYGQSEALGGVAAERLDDVRANRRPVGSVGRPLPGVEVRIVDPETGAPVASGTVGEITVRSPQIMRGYVGAADAPPIDAGGYLHTGDLGRLEDGILSVVGRAKDLIVSGGFNIYPAEVEAALAEAPGVDAAGVIGVHDERLGERAVAAIVSRSGDWNADHVDTFVRERLAPYKRPRAYVAIDDLPLTANGKPDRKTLAKVIAHRPEVVSVHEMRAALSEHGYLADEGLGTAIFLALRLQRPLLLEGEAGVGKTEVAKVLARWTGGQLIRLQCYEGLDVHQAVYEWDNARQLLHLRAAEAAGRASGRTTEALEDELYTERFLVRRAILSAIAPPNGSAGVPPVLLIDEIDRADDEFEAFLLEVLAEHSVTVPELGTFRAERPPVVVITSNRTRDVHDALKRRCLYHWVEHPDFAREVAIVRLRAPEVDERLAKQVAAAVEGLRAERLYKPPGVAETIDWAQALATLGRATLDQSSVEATLGTVLKYREDQERVRAKGVAELVQAAVLRGL